MPFTYVQAKSVFTSTTFYGALIGLLAAINPAVYAKIIGLFGVADPNAVAAKIVGILAFLLTLYGRWNATQPLALKSGPKMIEFKGPQPPSRSGSFTSIPPAA